MTLIFWMRTQMPNRNKALWFELNLEVFEKIIKNLLMFDF